MKAAAEPDQKPESPDDLLTVEEVAGVIRCDPQTVRRVGRAAGVLQVFGKRIIRIRRGDIPKLKDQPRG